jgi:hypothetical protein
MTARAGDEIGAIVTRIITRCRNRGDSEKVILK